MVKLPGKLAKKLEERSAKNSFRVLPSRGALVDFSSNDYLGFAGNSALRNLVAAFLKDVPVMANGATGSRLLSGNHPLYQQLENNLAKYHKVEEALVYNSGYDANLGIFASVPQRGDVILYDELVHASIRDGIRLGTAKAYKFRHNDIQDIRALTARIRSGQDDNCAIYLATESVFSMDGDSPNLHELLAFCEESNMLPIIDEAHALGVFGNGLLQSHGLQDKVLASIVTFGKAIGAHGAAILGSAQLKSYLTNFSRSLIYTTALPPHALATILMGYSYLHSEAGLRTQQQLRNNIEYFTQQLVALRLQDVFLASDSAIQVAVMGSVTSAKTCAEALQVNGLDVKPILSPTVAEGQERIRVCLHAFNSNLEMDKALEIIANHCHG